MVIKTLHMKTDMNTRRTYSVPALRFIRTQLEASFLGSNSLVDFVENDLYEEDFS